MADLNVALILRFIDQATGPARAALRNIQGAAERVERFGQAQIAAGHAMQEQAVANIAALRGEALALAGVGYAFAGLMGPAVRFEAQMDRVGAIARASAEEQDRLTASARELGRATSFNAEDAARGMEYLAMAGFSVDETISAMPGMLDLAAAAQADLGRTAELTSSMLRGFRLEADQTGRLGDVLVNTFTTSNTTFEGLGHTMAYVAPQAAAAGAGLEQVAAMAGLLGNTGIRGEMAGTALRAVLSRLAAPSNEAAEALARLNVQVSDEGGNLRDLPTILGEMDRAMQGMGTATRQELLTAIFGLEAATAAQVLMSEAGTGALQSYAERLRETGSAATLAERLTDNASGALERLQGAVDDVRLSLGNGFLPVLADMAERLVPIVDRVGAWVAANPELVSTMMNVAAGLIALNGALLAGRIAFWLLFGWVGRLRVALGLLATIASGHPIVALIAAIAAGAVTIYQNWDNIVAYFTDKFDRIAAAFQQGFLSGIIAAFQEMNPFVLIRDAALGLIEWLTGYDLAVIGTEWINRFTTGMREAWVIASAWLSGLAAEIATAIAAQAAALFEAGSALIQSLWDGAVARFDAFLQWLAAIPGRIVAAVGDIDLSSRVNFGGAAGPAPDGAPPAPLPPATRLNLGATLARATGGPVLPGLLYRINEQGLEGFASGDYFRPLTAGRIVPAGQTQRLMAGGGRGGSALTIGDIHIHALPGMDAADIARQVRDQLTELMREARFALHDGGLNA